MTIFKLANVLLQDMRQFYEAPKLFCHSDATLVPAKDDGIVRLLGPGSFDFTTYFNGLSVIKWRRYTVADNFHLHLELCGAAATVTLTHGSSFDYYTLPIEGSAVEVAASEDWTELDLDIPAAENDVLVSFMVKASGEVCLRNAYFYTEVADEAIRNVELAVSTTTFRKETYITHNIELVRKYVLGANEPISSHFRMYVIDNGRTLDAEALSGGAVTVYPNENVGGAGGFAYGMLLAQDQGDVTHILLMDDDVEMSPESFIRTFNILSLVRDEYTEAFLSGAMMDYDVPDSRWEDTGFMTKGGGCQQVKPPRNMSVLHEVLKDESFEPDYDSWSDLAQQYAAWWYCCIPLTQIRRCGMPLPIFVRFDDVEYGQRCAPKFMTMNGICVWHLHFFMRYSEGVERYQTARNGLVTQFTTGVSAQTDFFVEIRRNLRYELLKFNYAGAELVLEGLEDFLKGPDFFSAKGVAEKTFMAANRNREKLVPLAEIRDEALALTGVDVMTITADDLARDIPASGTPRGRVFDIGYKASILESLNGQLFGKIKSAFGRKAAVIEAYGWVFPMGKIGGVDHIVVIDVPSRKGAIRHRDAVRAKALWKRFNEDVKTFKREHDRLAAEYAAARPRITSKEFWRDYLGLEA